MRTADKDHYPLNRAEAFFGFVEYDITVEDDLKYPAAAAAYRDVNIATAGRK